MAVMRLNVSLSTKVDCTFLTFLIGKTSNVFSIPTSRSSTPSIIIKGEMKMTLSYQGPGLDWRYDKFLQFF